MITFKQIVDSSNGSEETMHASVEHVSNFVEKVATVQPHLAKMFLQDQYELMNGQHLNEWLAKEIVSKMWNTAPDGKSKIHGELISRSDAAQMLSDWPVDKQEAYRWDAYVAANAFAHDLYGVINDKQVLMKAAKAFWFGDEDRQGNKVYWYFKDEIFG